jgi:hypothetical protein
MDMVTTDFKGAEEKFIKEFDGWLGTQSLVDAVKCISPNISPSKFRSMGYDELVDYLIINLRLTMQTLFYLFAINKHGMSSTEIYN